MPAPQRGDALLARRVGVLVCAFSVLVGVCYAGEVLGDPGAWHCWGCRCQPNSSDHSLHVSLRKHSNDGPSLSFEVTHNYMYSVHVYVKILNDVRGKLGQELEIVITIPDGRNHYVPVARHPVARTAEGWILMQGDFKVSSQVSGQGHLKVQGPDPGVQFSVRGASVTNIWYGSGWRARTDSVIHDARQSDVILNVTTTGNVNPNEIEIQVVQKSKAFPVGTVVNAWTYNSIGNWRYRDYIHDHFNWAVLESSLKWVHVEPSRGQHNFHLPLGVVDSLRSKGLKIRGHNLVWSLEAQVPDWVRQLNGDDLRKAVRDHIFDTVNRTRGRLEHWDASNENLHGQWFQERLQDFSWEQTPFLQAHSADPHVKLFLNDFDIVAHGTSTGAYIEQARRLQRAGVGLYGLGVQCHFWNEEEPDPYLIKDRLDKLAQTGLPIWVTEFNVVAANEDRRADFLETAMRAFYGHPAVEGILIWGFWDKAHSRGPHAALVKGDSLQPTSAGRRFLDLWERQWMTDHTHVPSESGSRVTVRGFHGDYEMQVRYQGKELVNLRQNFTLGKVAHTVSVHIRV